MKWVIIILIVLAVLLAAALIYDRDEAQEERGCPPARR